MTSARRIVNNTLSTYVRLFVVALTGLFAVPVALRTLGAVDYGIYSVIGGCLAFLTFLNISLQTGAQRHIAYALGERREEEASKWFRTSLIVHVILGLGVAVFAMSLSHWVLHHLLTIPPSRLAAGAWIYRMVVSAMVCNVVLTPYQALLMAHEAITSISLLQTLSGIFLMVSVFCLKFLPGDYLLWYGAMYCACQISMAAGPALYCYWRYPESRVFSLATDRFHLRELFSFSGWTMLLVLSTFIRAQGPAVVLNMFFGPLANAAYGLAVQVQWFASGIVWGLLGATTPPIVKRQAAGDSRGMARLSNQSNIYAFAILWMVLAPVLFEMNFCLKIWLHTPPANTGAFLLPVLIALIIDQLTLSYNVSLGATGQIAAFSFVVSIANCVGVPVGYLLLRRGLSGTWVLWALVLGIVIAGVARLWFASKLAAISIKSWVREVLFTAALCAVGSVGLSLALIQLLPDGFARLGVIGLANCLVVCTATWFIATSPAERAKLKAFGASVLARLAGNSPERAREVAGETV